MDFLRARVLGSELFFCALICSWASQSAMDSERYRALPEQERQRKIANDAAERKLKAKKAKKEKRPGMEVPPNRIKSFMEN